MKYIFENNGKPYVFVEEQCGGGVFPVIKYSNINTFSPFEIKSADLIDCKKVVKQKVRVKKLFGYKEKENEIEVDSYAIKIGYKDKMECNSTNYVEIDVLPTEYDMAREVVVYLNKLIGIERELCRKQSLEETKEYERIHGKQRYSKIRFTFFDGNMFLKYAYYDVEVKGTDYFEFDISKIEIDSDISFKEEPNNKYDENAILIVNGERSIGYVPNNKIQDMIHDYINDGSFVEGWISRVDEDNKAIQVAIGFYREMTEDELKKIPHIDASLIKTTKKDDFDISRQDNLELVQEGTVIDFYYDVLTGTYVVSDDMGNELGEISENKSDKLQEYEMEGKKLHGIIIETGYSDSGRRTCKVRILISE